MEPTLLRAKGLYCYAAAEPEEVHRDNHEKTSSKARLKNRGRLVTK